MSEDVVARFQQAAEAVKGLSESPDNEVLLKLYALYKQATKGDCEGKRPGMIDFVGRAKFDAWAALAGMAQEAAMEEYAALVNALLEADSA
ncbi:MAG: acyl-CoA-binding protein [Candidatus Hydrogenedentes bacterium]|nr:acyl-CoA-binding protein [Candidatus Hydrogenedentota bacterium]